MSDKRKISDGRKPISNSKFVIPNSFSDLIRQIHRTHAELTAQAYKAVNVSLTLRNWLIGLHITEYEQQGLDRAQYGTALLKNLSIALKQLSVSNCNERELRRYRQFYQEYPQIRGALTPELTDRIPLPANSGGAPQIPAVSENTAKIDGKTLISRLSFTHISELLRLENPQQRAFYEVEAILGNWSIRELKRQIGSLYFERSGLSHNKQKLSELAQTTAEKLTGLNIRDP
jgi:hypothetical protein